MNPNHPIHLKKDEESMLVAILQQNQHLSYNKMVSTFNLSRSVSCLQSLQRLYIGAKGRASIKRIIKDFYENKSEEHKDYIQQRITPQYLRYKDLILEGLEKGVTLQSKMNYETNINEYNMTRIKPKEILKMGEIKIIATKLIDGSFDINVSTDFEAKGFTLLELIGAIAIAKKDLMELSKNSHK